jgi:uncharacterized damage-inducible protein DinB
MESAAQQIFQYLIEEVKRRIIEEGQNRILKCLDQVSEEEVWKRPNEQSNSIGNLVLHLCGNIRQWAVAGLGKQADDRQRQQEFDERGPIAKEELIRRLSAALSEVEEVLDRVTCQDLIQTYPVQTFDENGVSILVHITEHFSYHVGQITFYVKAMKDLDLGYYEGIPLE